MVSMWCTTPCRIFSLPKVGGRVRSGNSAKSWWYVDSPIMVFTNSSLAMAAYPIVDNWVVVFRSLLFRGSMSNP